MSDLSRREFLKSSASTAAAAGLITRAPAFLGATDKAGVKSAIVGEGEFTYECHHGWGEVPEHVTWGDTHGVCVDSDGLIYVKHRQKTKEPMDSIVVFDPDGKCVRSFGKEHHGGGHGIDVRNEGGEEFLYLSCIRKGYIAKATLTGEEVWRKRFPVECGRYNKKNPRYAPTNICFAPDGGFYVGDGYGSHFIHQYDRDANWVRTWGGAGKAAGKMQTPHGLWLDDRGDGEPTIAVCDRANARLQYFSLDGKHLNFVEGLSFPADLDLQGDVLLCPDLHARITLLDKDNNVITHLGYDQAWTDQVLGNKFAMRSQPNRWQAGRFLHPHDACFDADGNIIVAEWVPTGRVSFLKKVS